MPGPAPRVDLAQSTALKASIFKPWKEGGADCYSIRVDGNYRAHGKYDRDESVWSAVEIGTHIALGDGWILRWKVWTQSELRPRSAPPGEGDR
jgi:hypothetical protein